jgi:membrane associated rhomboid family serine protease
MRIEPPRPTLLRRLLHPAWTNVVPLVSGRDGDDFPHAGNPGERTLQDWRLVLLARNIPCRIRTDREHGVRKLVVPAWFARRAAEEIGLYLRENRDDPVVLPAEPLRAPGAVSLPLGFMCLMILFHACTTMAFPVVGIFPGHWEPLGSAHAERMLAGEWWRAVTALTLHGNAAHVLGNAVVGGTFLVILGRQVGPGLALFLSLACGVAGNMINAVVLGPPHDSIGFSTAVFGTAGLLASVHPFVAGTVARAGPVNVSAWLFRAMHSFFVPMAAGLGLLAMLGSGGENTDLGAHLFGFCSGLVTGLPLGLFVRSHGPLARPVDRFAAWLCLLMIIVAWIVVSC